MALLILVGRQVFHTPPCKSIDALNSYRQLLLDKDIAITIVWFITILQNK